MKNFQKLNGFYLKILAFLFMTLDHVGVFLISYAKNPAFSDPMYMTGYVFRCIGRLAFPLFILLLVEGIRHTKNIKLYLLRIGIITTLVMAAQIIIFYFIDSNISSAMSPLVDLSIAAVTLMLLKRKDKLSYLAIIPIAYSFLCAGITVFEIANDATVKWLPFYLRSGYSILGLGLALAFYYSYHFADLRVKKLSDDLPSMQQSQYYRSLVSLIQIAFLVGINILLYILSFVTYNGKAILDIYIASIQTWSLFAAVFILLYNGKRGYNKKWFQYGSYFYFPVHLIIIYFIFYLIFM